MKKFLLFYRWHKYPPNKRPLAQELHRTKSDRWHSCGGRGLSLAIIPLLIREVKRGQKAEKSHQRSIRAAKFALSDWGEGGREVELKVERKARSFYDFMIKQARTDAFPYILEISPPLPQSV